MLQHLRVKDFAIIDEVELDFPTGFTVVTGETGAGKSILVNALGLILGGRANADVVRAGSDVAEVEALFDISGQPLLQARLAERELAGDDPNVLLVRRVVGTRSRVLINGHLATVAMLHELARGLVDISGQHEQQSLLEVDSHLTIVDAYGELGSDLRAYAESFAALQALLKERAALTKSEQERTQRLDYLRFQLEEIERLAPEPGEDERLAEEERRLVHADRLRQLAVQAEGALYSDDGSGCDRIGAAVLQLEELVTIDPALQGVLDNLQGARRELEDAARELQRYGDGIEGDPARLEEVANRLVELRRIVRKHGGTLAEVCAKTDLLREELSRLENAETTLQELATCILAAEAEVVRLGEILTRKRKRAGTRLCEAVKKELEAMELVGAELVLDLQPRAARGEACSVAGRSATAEGLDDVQFLWSANPGELARPLARIASGGELSRLMLAVKTILCQRDLVSVYVFDEVDTGLGGRAADAIGRRIQTVAKDHQAITITHLAPIAARADHHLRVVKDQDAEGRTVSRFDVVLGRERADEVARMIDGANVSRVTRQAAREMLGRASVGADGDLHPQS